MRHNALRDLNAELQREVCKDVITEPRLLPLNDEEVNGTAADRAARTSLLEACGAHLSELSMT